MTTPDRDELKALLVELLAEIEHDRVASLRGAALEFQSAMEAIHNGLGAMFGAWGSLGTKQAASVSILQFERIEAQEQKTEAQEVAIERIAQRIDAGDARLIDARQEGTILRDIANEERDASTSQLDELNRKMAEILARIDRLERRTGFLSDKEK